MYDLTHTISESMLLYPGIPQPRLHDFATPAVDGYGMSEFTFWNHLGTHIDAPTHFYADGWSLDQFPIERFLVTVQTVDCRDVPHITAQHLANSLRDTAPLEGVLLLTGQYRHWGTPRYFEPFATLTEDGADWLLARRAGMILVDAPSVDAVDTTDFPNHHRLLRAPLLVVENLAYHESLPDTFPIAALPIKVQHANGCPARVVTLD